MGIFSFFRHTSSKEILEKAQVRIAELKKQRAELETHRQSKLQRQAELWSILAPSQELEAEYKVVSTVIADDIQKIAALDEYDHKLHNAFFFCQRGECASLETILKAADPLKDVHYEVPIVHYTFS